MNILLIGYGKMGQTIESIAIDRGHTIAGIIDSPSNPRDKYTASNVDVAIEFSQPDSAAENMQWAIETGIPILSGTTGWLAEYSRISTLCRELEGTMFYASNYSLGVNIFFKLNKYLAGMINQTGGYDVSISETHHLQKKDSPSGTAITLAEGIISQITQKTAWIEGEDPDGSKLSIQSFREPDVPGTHVITYDGEEDSIEIRHTAHSRKGFALGAVLVAEWLGKGQTGVLGMDDFLDF